MERKKDSFVSIGETLSGLDGPVKAIREASPPARHHFTQADQVNQLVGASEADPDLGFMARLMALCSLPRMGHPRNRKRAYTYLREGTKKGGGDSKRDPPPQYARRAAAHAATLTSQIYNHSWPDIKTLVAATNNS